ncbi:MAG: iron ABC transporter permease [Bacteroidetes bacterium]|nr:iron ABC transporter permease [Bacteroidota bacterium]
MLWGLSSGAVTLNPWETAVNWLSGESGMHTHILWQIRLPRILLAGMVGALLALTGSALQALFRNPLAEPSLLGISGGGSMGAALSIVLGTTWLGATWLEWEIWLMPAAAFAGSLMCTLLIFGMARNQGNIGVQHLLLAGVATNALAGAVVGLMLVIANDTQARSLTFWTLGSFGSSSWEALGMIALFGLPVMCFLLGQPRRLDLLLLGETEATHLGLRVERFKKTLITLTALSVGAAVAFTGIIGFIGLVAPHVVRLCCGPGHKQLLPLSALLGAILAIVADTLARTLAAPVEIPVGLLLALIGVPFFLYLIRRSQK